MPLYDLLTTLHDQANLFTRRVLIPIGTIYEMRKRPFAKPLEQRVRTIAGSVLNKQFFSSGSMPGDESNKRVYPVLFVLPPGSPATSSHALPGALASTFLHPLISFSKTKRFYSFNVIPQCKAANSLPSFFRFNTLRFSIIPYSLL